jgi:hypothetical protein
LNVSASSSMTLTAPFLVCRFVRCSKNNLRGQTTGAVNAVHCPGIQALGASACLMQCSAVNRSSVFSKQTPALHNMWVQQPHSCNQAAAATSRAPTCRPGSGRWLLRRW